LIDLIDASDEYPSHRRSPSSSGGSLGEERGSGGKVSSSRSRRPSHRRERGQGIIGFALVAPILIGLIFGVFDIGRALSANVTVTNSSREGARYLIANAVSPGAASYWNSSSACQSASGATAPSANSGEAAAWRQLQGASLDLSKVSMTIYFYSTDPSSDGTSNHGGAAATITCPSTGTPTDSNPTYAAASGTWVLFSMTYLYTPTTPLISRIIGTVTMTQTTTMVIE
jgi:Flp pilus assembly protein TadG